MYEEWFRKFLDAGFGITSFDDPGNGDGGGGGSAANSAGDGQGNGDGQGDGTQQQQSQKPYATFPTQSSLNDRLNRAKDSVVKELAKEAGFGDDIDGFREHVKKDKERRDREAGELATTKSSVASLTAENAQLKTNLRTLSLRSAVESVAGTLGFHDPGDAFGLANWSDIEIGDDGAVDRDKIKTRLTDLTKSKPYLLKEQQQSQQSNQRQRQQQQNNGDGQQQQRGDGQQSGASAPNPGRQPPGRQVTITDEKMKEYERRFPVLKQR
jgi:hypothetical protein